MSSPPEPPSPAAKNYPARASLRSLHSCKLADPARSGLPRGHGSSRHLERMLDSADIATHRKQSPHRETARRSHCSRISLRSLCQSPAWRR